MDKVKILKHTDFDISINRDFELMMNYQNEKVFQYPVIIGQELQVEVPEHLFSIHDFLAHKKNVLKGEDVSIFLKLANINLTPFIWNLMQDMNLDFYWNVDDLYIRHEDTYVVLNNRNVDLSIIDKLYKVQDKPHMYGTYRECMDDLYAFVRNKITNSIGHNEFINAQMKDYKNTEMELEKECRNDSYHFAKILILYEKLIRIKEKFLNENHYLMPQQEIDEIYEILKQIRILLKNQYSHKYHVERM